MATIQIIARRSKAFMTADGKSVTVFADPGPQPVPEWVRETGTFQVGVEDGSIVPIQILVPTKTESAQAEAPASGDPSGDDAAAQQNGKSQPKVTTKIGK